MTTTTRYPCRPKPPLPPSPNGAHYLVEVERFHEGSARVASMPHTCKHCHATLPLGALTPQKENYGAMAAHHRRLRKLQEQERADAGAA